MDLNNFLMILSWILDKKDVTNVAFLFTFISIKKHLRLVAFILGDSRIEPIRFESQWNK